MRRRVSPVFLIAMSVSLLLQVGCLTAADVRAVAEGQFVSFVNALINTVTSDAIRGTLGG